MDRNLADYAALLGVLVECDPSIKAIIVKLDAESGHKEGYIIEELDDQHVVVKENRLTELKMKLDDVSIEVVSY